MFYQLHPTPTVNTKLLTSFSSKSRWSFSLSHRHSSLRTLYKNDKLSSFADETDEAEAQNDPLAFVGASGWNCEVVAAVFRFTSYNSATLFAQ